MRRKIKAVVLDLSGTVVDRYALAPTYAVKNTFAHFGVDISISTARGPMGIAKDRHFNLLLDNDAVKKAWGHIYGSTPKAEMEGKMLFKRFHTEQLDCLEKYSTVLPKAVEAFEELRSLDVKISATTGFSRDIVNVLRPMMAEQGLEFDYIVAATDLEWGSRPFPHGLYECMRKLGVHDVDEVLKVDDSVPGIREGRAAKATTCGVSRYSSYMAIESLFHESQIPFAAMNARHNESRRTLLDGGADYVVDSIANIPNLVIELTS